MVADHGDHWIFGYGSLMWRPGFEYAERQEARLHGYHRAFCVYSHVHRGTPERPGLVLGLDRGGSCRGVAFRVTPEVWPAAYRYLQEREQVTAVYRDVFTPVRLLESGTTAPAALTFVVDRTHHQYAGMLSIEAQAEIVAGAVGRSGANPDYLDRTVDHLDEMGIHDASLRAVRARVRAMTGVSV